MIEKTPSGEISKKKWVPLKLKEKVRGMRMTRGSEGSCDKKRMRMKRMGGRQKTKLRRQKRWGEKTSSRKRRKRDCRGVCEERRAVRGKTSIKI